MSSVSPVVPVPAWPLVEQESSISYSEVLNKKVFQAFQFDIILLKL